MKQALRLLPWPVTLIGTYAGGRHNLMTASWVSQVSFRPPLVMVSVAPERYTYEMLQASGEFVVSILAADQQRWAEFCGSRSGRDVDKVKELGLKTAPAEKVKVPLLADCVANLECRVVSMHAAGDHVLFVGEVIAGNTPRPGAVPLVIKDWEYGRYAKD